MIKLRWLTRSYRITADQVRAYADEHELSLMGAKQELSWPGFDPVLQQWDDNNGCWVNVPSEHEYVERTMER